MGQGRAKKEAKLACAEQCVKWLGLDSDEPGPGKNCCIEAIVSRFLAWWSNQRVLKSSDRKKIVNFFLLKFI